MNSRGLLLVFLFFSFGCSTVIVDIQTPSKALSSEPTFRDYRSYIFWGFLQTKHVSVGKACLGQTPLRLKSYASTEDILLSAVTLGIYTSRTVDVWCEEPSRQTQWIKPL